VPWREYPCRGALWAAALGPASSGLVDMCDALQMELFLRFSYI
jgi:hypothetical protein